MQRPARVIESSDTPARPDDYVRRGGCLMVRPYYFDFVCSVKQRMQGKNILDIFSQEFPLRSRSYYEEAFADGRLRVEGCTVGATTPLRQGQQMRHFIHRHEPPVLDALIQVVGVTEEVVAVAKPGGMPVHVAGQYRKNTVAALLGCQRPDLLPLLPVHRLDKPVSGLLLFARSPTAADALRQAIQGEHVEKVYVARVQGSFPAGATQVDAALSWDPKASIAAVAGRCPPGKAAVTDFRLLGVAPDRTTSLVECRPRTGRSHQIRVHLQHLGHPIANDTQYGGTFPGPDLARGYAKRQKLSHPEGRHCMAEPVQQAAGPATEGPGASNLSGAPPQPARPSAQADEGAVDEPTASIHRPTAEQGGAAVQPDPTHACEDLCRQSAASEAHDVAGSNAAVGSSPAEWLVDEELRDDLCTNCPQLIPKGWPTNLTPLWLHALRYSGSGWSFQCRPPDWAEPDWVTDLPQCKDQSADYA